jgi:membrane-bound ClpP family serine protease
VDVVTDGEYVDAGEPVEVIRVDGNRIVVRRAPGATERSES